MRAYKVAAWMVLCLGVAAMSMAQAPSADQQDVEKLLQSLQVPAGATESPVVYKTDEGFVRFLGAPAQGAFAVPSTAKAAGPEPAARAFLSTYKGALGLSNDKVGLNTESVRVYGGQHYVRLNQTYNSLNVFAGSVVVQVDGANDVRNVVCEVMRDTRAVDDSVFAFTPGLADDEAAAKGKKALAKALAADDDITGVDADTFILGGNPELLLYSPTLLGQSGAIHLAWLMTLTTDTPEHIVQRILVDAQSGELLLHYSMTDNSLSRQVYDCNYTTTFPTTPVRVEGGAATGISDVDKLYDYLGDGYNFYADHFGRDSYDDNGSTINAYANYTMMNAYWDSFSEQLVVGTGWATDDIVVHEFAHANTGIINEDLIYFGESGSLNEHFSDTFGEFVDQTNGRGNDSSSARWLIGEDLSQIILDQLNSTSGMLGFRNMKNPPEFDQPDRYNSPLFINPYAYYDYGGVHVNNGVGNKLVYLLTDGDSFNGQTVKKIGMDKVAELVYASEFLLPYYGTYYYYYLALGAASVTLNFTFEERLNVARAGRAVEIEPPTLEADALTGFRAISAFDTDGNPVVALHWTNPTADEFSQVTLVRSVGAFADNPDEGTELYSGLNDSYLDQDVQSGVEYYYTLFADMTTGLPEVAYARATAGALSSKTLTEAFSTSDSTPVDLAYSQILFTPVGAPSSTSSSGGSDYANYEATITHSVYELPVAASDAEGSAWYTVMTDDSSIYFTMSNATFPYFGRGYSRLFVSSNGCVTFKDVIASDLKDISLATHFSVPRISFLFADLNPSAGGTIWSRDLADRLVLTFQDVPEYISGGSGYGSARTNTIQVELFYSGHIRVTYLNLGVNNAVVGLSDGQGVPIDPATLFDNVRHLSSLSSLSELPETHSHLSIDPVAPVSVDPGDLITFSASTTLPAGTTSFPVLTATWDGDGTVPFADNTDGTGTFYWQTTVEDQGLFVVRVRARLGDEEAFQDVYVLVGDSLYVPEATNLTVSSDTAYEDPTQDRVVADNRPLIAAYEYYHAQGLTEGNSLLYWYRNGQIVPGLTGAHNPDVPTQDSPSVPASATHPGDRWYFRVLPIATAAVSGSSDTYQIIGYEAMSPVVTIAGGPEVLSVTPNFGDMVGGETVRIFGANLSGALSVKFGGVPAASIHAISKNELQVVTPLISQVGTVSVMVTTSDGSGSLPGAYTYQTDEITPSDKTYQIMGCGTAAAEKGGLGDWMVLVAALACLAAFSRRPARAR